MLSRRAVNRTANAFVQRRCQSGPSGGVGGAAGAATRHPLLSVGVGVATAIVGYTVLAQGKKEETSLSADTREISPRAQGKFHAGREFPYDWRDDDEDQSFRNEDRANTFTHARNKSQLPTTELAKDASVQMRLKDFSHTRQRTDAVAPHKDDLKDKLSEKTADAKQKGKELSDTASDKFDEVKLKGKHLKSKTADKLDDAKDKIIELKDKTFDKAGEMKKAVSSKAVELKDDINQKLERQGDMFHTRRREYPYEWRDELDDRLWINSGADAVETQKPGIIQRAKARFFGGGDSKREYPYEWRDELDDGNWKEAQKDLDLNGAGAEKLDDIKQRGKVLKNEASRKGHKLKDQVVTFYDDARDRVIDAKDRIKHKSEELQERNSADDFRLDAGDNSNERAEGAQKPSFLQRAKAKLFRSKEELEADDHDDQDAVAARDEEPSESESADSDDHKQGHSFWSRAKEMFTGAGENAKEKVIDLKEAAIEARRSFTKEAPMSDMQKSVAKENIRNADGPSPMAEGRQEYHVAEPLAISPELEEKQISDEKMADALRHKPTSWNCAVEPQFGEVANDLSALAWNGRLRADQTPAVKQQDPQARPLPVYEKAGPVEPVITREAREARIRAMENNDHNWTLYTQEQGHRWRAETANQSGIGPKEYLGHYPFVMENEAEYRHDDVFHPNGDEQLPAPVEGIAPTMAVPVEGFHVHNINEKVHPVRQTPSNEWTSFPWG